MRNPPHEFVVVALRYDGNHVIKEPDKTISRNLCSRQDIARYIPHMIRLNVVRDHLGDARASPGFIVLRRLNFRTNKGYNTRCVVNAVEKQLADLNNTIGIDG